MIESQKQKRRCYTISDVINGQDVGSDLNNSKLLHNLKENPLLRALSVSHNLDTENTGALTEATNIVLEASSPNAIGRSLVRVIETTKESIQIRKTRLGRAAKTARSKKGASFGQRNEYLTINITDEIEVSDKWDLQYLESVEYDVAAEEARALGINHDIEETKNIIKFLDGIPLTELSGGENVPAISAKTFTFDDIVNMWNRIVREDFTPDTLVVHPDQLSDLMKSKEFKDQTLLGSNFKPESGQFGKLLMGLNVISSSFMTAGNVFVLNSKDVVMYPIRRDKMMTSFQPSAKEFEMQLTTRYGIATGRPEEMAKMTDA